MHLAAGLGVDHIALFGSSYSTSTGPVVKKKCLSLLLETGDRRGCDKACYKYQCSVDKDYPCINEIHPETVYHHVLDEVLNTNAGKYGPYKEINPKISGYTHVFNAEAGGYPFVESIQSMLGFCDEIIVIDGGSEDGTIERINEIGDDRIKLVERKWDWTEPGMDGQQKAYGRAMCTGDFLWQQDVDEVVHEDDYNKIRKLVKRFPNDCSLLHLPIIELWGDEKTVRTDRHSWKWRLSRSDFKITHGIAKHARVLDEETGKIYAKRGQSDGCEYIDIMTNEYVPHKGFYSQQIENIRSQNPEAYGNLMQQVFEQLPSVYHYSWANIPRKIRNFKQFWDKCWTNLYREQKPEDRFPDVSLDDEESIILKSAELKKQGGEHELAPTFQLNRSNPKIMKEWLK
jgi:glycosyltransferase involved in cell wall biosynthesis